jgi:hypothetical protein
MDITQGSILNQYQPTTVGSVTEEQGNALSRIAEKFAAKKIQERVEDNTAMAALEGIQSAAMGKTISEIQAGTPLYDALMNIDARAQQAKAYYANNVASEVANEVNLGLSKYRDLAPEQARDAIYKDYMTAINQRAGGDVNTFNAISSSALQHVSRSYSMQGLEYIQEVQRKTDDEQAKAISSAVTELNKATEGLKNTDDPSRIERYHQAIESYENVALPAPGQDHDRFQKVIQKATLSMANKAGTTETIQNPDGTTTEVYNGAQDINSFIKTPLFQSLPAETQHHVLSARATAETRVIQSLPNEALMEQANLRIKAREAGASPEAIMRTGLALNQKWKDRLGLVNADIMSEAEIEQLGTSRFAANKAAVLEAQRQAAIKQKEAEKAQDETEKNKALDGINLARFQSPDTMYTVYTPPKQLNEQWERFQTQQFGRPVSVLNGGKDVSAMIQFQRSSQTIVPAIQAQLKGQAEILLFSSDPNVYQSGFPAFYAYQEAKQLLKPEQMVDLYGADIARKMDILVDKVNNGKVPFTVAHALVVDLEKGTTKDTREEASKLLGEKTQGNIMGFMNIQTEHLPSYLSEYQRKLIVQEMAIKLGSMGETASQTEKQAVMNNILNDIKILGRGSSLFASPLMLRGDSREWEQQTTNYTNGGTEKPMGPENMERITMEIVKERTEALSKQHGRVFTNNLATALGRFQSFSVDGKPEAGISVMAFNDDGDNIPLVITSSEIQKRWNLEQVTKKAKESKRLQADEIKRAEAAVKDARAQRLMEGQFGNAAGWEMRERELEANAGPKKPLWNLKQNPPVDN